MSKVCPNCKMEIESINFDVTATCGGSLYPDENADYDLSCLTDNVEFDNFRCPECDEVICLSEEEAIKLLKESKSDRENEIEGV